MAKRGNYQVFHLVQYVSCETTFDFSLVSSENLLRNYSGAAYNQNERNHSVRFAVGNGMASEIWHEFQTRFNISTINEFYASTEGNCNVMNPLGHPLSCGFLPCGPARAMFPGYRWLIS